MLTKRHLMIIRAALQFFDEEISPHGPDGARSYFEEPLKKDLQAGEVRQLRKLLRTCELKYVCCDQTGDRIVSQKLTTTMKRARNAANIPCGRIASVLLAPET